MLMKAEEAWTLYRLEGFDCGEHMEADENDAI